MMRTMLARVTFGVTSGRRGAQAAEEQVHLAAGEPAIGVAVGQGGAEDELVLAVAVHVAAVDRVAEQVARLRADEALADARDARTDVERRRPAGPGLTVVAGRPRPR
jgi:hypothetical protein